jgi:RNA polymerase sigma-70 factor (ECF subfamily)
VVGSDRDLWNRLRSADQHALTDLFHRHSDAVYNFAFRRTSSWSAAEDVVQATFTALWRRARSGSVDELTLESARPLLLVMAGYECRNVHRSSRRQAALTDRIELIDQVGAVPDHASDAAARIDDERARSEVRRILGKIPAKQREVVELVVWSECPRSRKSSIAFSPTNRRPLVPEACVSCRSPRPPPSPWSPAECWPSRH